MTPGVYVEEVSTGPKPIQALGTNVAGFVGVAPRSDRHVNEVIPINNFGHFVRVFVDDEHDTTTPPTTPLATAVFGFFENGGGRCYVVNVGPGGSIGGGRREGLNLFEEHEDIALVAAPGYSDFATHRALLDHCGKLKYRVALLDCPEDITWDTLDRLKQPGSAPTARAARAAEAEGDDEDRPRRRASTPPAGFRPPQVDSGLGAFYFPWITIKDPLNPKKTLDVPPSGHIAGICARVDTQRGVHKAPANESIRGALNVTYRVTDDEQSGLNDAGVNCIRFLDREGIRVWGARTVAASASEWRYLSVRRLFCMIEQSIARGTRWVVFEPNDETLWRSIQRDVSAFLTLCWRDGALKGATPEQAFFVQCDAETNPPEVIDAGQVIIKIGICPVKPAEFVIFRIGQWAGGTEIETESEGESENGAE
jgi:hypothetical protein